MRQRARGAKHVLDRVAAAGAGEIVGILAVGQRRDLEALAGFQQRQRQIERAIGGAAAGLVAVETKYRLVRHAPHQAELIGGKRGAERRNRRLEARGDHGDDVDIALDRDHARAVMRGLSRIGDVVERAALVKERRLRRIEVFRRHLLVERAAAKGDDLAAPVADRKHHAVAEAVVRHGNVFAGDDEACLRHVLDGNLRRAEMLLQRILIAGRIAEPEFKLRRRMHAAVEQIAAAARAVSGSERRLENISRRSRRCR